MAETAGNALISVYDKTGIADFAGGLHEMDWNIWASGGTFREISGAGVPARDIAELVGGEAILGHRVVTLSREVASALLAMPAAEGDMKDMAKHKYPLIHLVCQDSYPLEEAIANPDATPESIWENIDIGGPNLLREAAKGQRVVLSVSEQRQAVLEWLRSGRPDEERFIRDLTDRARYEVARYTLIEAQHYNGSKMVGFVAIKSADTKYGENPQQAEAAFYADNRVNVDPLGLDQFQHVQGMERSFVNMTDIDRLLQTSTHIAAGFERNFGAVPAMAVGVKHGNACGAAVGDDMVEVVKNMIDGDTRAIFGGVVMLNGVIDTEVAETLMHHSMRFGRQRVLDGVIGADVTDEALEILSRKKLRVVTNPSLAELTEASLDSTRRIRPVRGGVLAQPNYDFVMEMAADYMETHGELSVQQKRDLILGWGIGSTSNSNTIPITNGGMLIGNGVGQQDRIGAVQLALSRTTTGTPRLRRFIDRITMTTTFDRAKLEGASAYSDSFFPFPDAPELLAKAGIGAILTSSGSVNDQDIVKRLAKRGVSVAMVPDKLGRGFFNH